MVLSRLFTDDQGSKLSCIVLCVGSVNTAHSFNSASI